MRRRRQNAGAGLRPLDEDDRVVEVRLEVAPLRAPRPPLEAVEVEVRHVDAGPGSGGRSCSVGLVTGPSTPSARHAPRTNVVLPEPSSPETVTTSPGRRSRGEPGRERSRSLRASASRSEQPELDRRLRRLPGGEQTGCCGGATCAAHAARAAARSRTSARRACAACRAPRRDGRSGTGARTRPPSVDLLLLAVHARDPGRPARQELRREVAERRDDARLDQLDLPPEMCPRTPRSPRAADRDSRRAALQNVDHVDVRTRQARCRRAAGRAACPPRRRTGRLACPRGSRAPRPRTSDRSSGSPEPNTTCVAPAGECALGAAGNDLAEARSSSTLVSSVTAATASAATAAATAERAGLPGGADHRERRELPGDVGRAALRARNLLIPRTSSSKCSSHFMQTYSYIGIATGSLGGDEPDGSQIG